MAIYSAVPPPPGLQSHSSTQPQNASQQQQQQQQHPPPTASGPIDIEAWTISALEALSVAPAATGTTGTPLGIPLDEHHHHHHHHPNAQSAAAAGRVTIAADATPTDGPILPPRRPPSRRDSMRRRELLLKGKEGSRQRRRYDMKRLTDVPNVEPPEPRDWEPRPVHPVQHVPYHVAVFWDRGLSQQVEEKKNTAARKKIAAASGGYAIGAGAGGSGTAGRVPRELRDTVKRTPGVKGWLRALEEPVREFLAERQRAAGLAPPAEDESDDSDDEVVFVGRKKNATSDAASAASAAAAAVGAAPARDNDSSSWKSAHREVRDGPAVDRGMVFDSSGDDEGSASFKRWLTHSISDYYGLASRSVTVGTPARRCVYVGVRDVDLKIRTALPRPLWEIF